MVLDEYDPSTSTIVARESIILKPGFSVTGTEGFTAVVDPDKVYENVDADQVFMNAYKYDDKYQVE